MENNRFREKKILIYKQYVDYFKTKRNPEDFGEFLSKLKNDFTGLIFYEIEADSLGGSGGNPTWGYVYKYFGNEEKEEDKLVGVGEAIYKEYDYDYPYDAYCENIYSALGKHTLTKARVPKIDVAIPNKSNDPTTISYCVFDSESEEMFEIKDFLYNKFDNDELREKQNIISIKDILECIKISIDDDENYKEIEEGVIQVLALDSIANNPDRHPNNWSIIRNIETGKYELAIFDNSRSFYHMVQKYDKNNSKWSPSYVITEERKRNGLGDFGDKVLKYLSRDYKEYFDRFMLKFMNELPRFYKDLDEMPYSVDKKNIKKEIDDKLRYIRKLYDVEKEEVHGRKDNGDER